MRGFHFQNNGGRCMCPYSFTKYNEKKMLDNKPGRLGEETSEFKARLGYLVTSRLVWAT